LGLFHRRGQCVTTNVGDVEANAQLERVRRKGYELPDPV
jgi:hypothetical protein